MRAIWLALYLSLGTAVADDSQMGVTPVQKVIEMLNDMKAKGEKEKHEEMVEFATYKQFCMNTMAEKKKSIADGKDMIEQLNAEIAKAGADVLTLTKEIASLSADIDGWKAEKDEAVAIRTKDHEDFQVVHADYTAAMEAVDRALQVIKTSPGQFLQVQESLLQLQSVNRVLKPQSEEAESLLQLSSRQQPKTYESSSGGIIDMIKKLGKKFKSERYEIEKEEAKVQAAHDLKVQDLTDFIEKASTASDEKMATKAKREKDGKEAEGSLGDTTNALGGDEKFLEDLASECEMKSNEFETNQVLRAGELTAIGKAIEIMSSDKISGGSLVQSNSPSLVQESVSLAQLRTDQRSTSQNRAMNRVAMFLNSRAQQTNSRILSLLAVKVSEDPFKKVTKMIRDMITKLMEEANEEAEHKGFCDTEMGKNKFTRDEKSQKVEKLTALIEELTASITKLGEESTVLSAAIAEIDAAMSKATAERNEESARNQAVIKEAAVAAEATAQALTVLKEFYAKADEGASLIQRMQKPYKGMGGGGVVGMLEVIESDFVRLQTETTTEEDKASEAFTKFSRDCSKDKALKETDLKHVVNAKTEKESELADAQKELKGTQEELDAALAYFEKLKPSCVDAGQSYEERVAQRKAEIESLQDAFKILNGEA